MNAPPRRRRASAPAPAPVATGAGRRGVIAAGAIVAIIATALLKPWGGVGPAAFTPTAPASALSSPRVLAVQSPEQAGDPTPTSSTRSALGRCVADPVTGPDAVLRGQGWTALKGGHVPRGGVAGLGPSGDGTWDVVLVDPSTGSVTRLTHFGRTDYRFPHLLWSPDGSDLAVGWEDAPWNGGCWPLYVVAGGRVFDPAPVSSTEQNWEPGAWSPDSSVLAIARARTGPVGSGAIRMTLGLLHANGRNDFIDLPCADCTIRGAPIWSPNGRLIAANVGAGASALGIAVVHPSSGAARLIPGLVVVGWQDAGHLLVSSPRAVVTDAAPLAVVGLDLASGPPRPIRPKRRIDGLASPDGTHFLTIVPQGGGHSERDSLVVVDAASGSKRVIWRTPLGTSAAEVVWAPDGSATAVSVWWAADPEKSVEGTGLWIVPTDGSGARQVSPTPLRALAWQPD